VVVKRINRRTIGVGIPRLITCVIVSTNGWFEQLNVVQALNLLENSCVTYKYYSATQQVLLC